MNLLARNIPALRKAKGISAAALRAATGLGQELTLIEKGQQQASPAALVAISDALGYPIDRLLREDLSALPARIRTFKPKLLAMDVDGVLTDGGMYYAQGGDEFKKFNTKDGMALIKLAEAGVPTAFISSGINDGIIGTRAKMLKVPYVYVGTWKKLGVLEGWCKEMKIALNDVAYIGDDVNDLAVMQAVGLSACPSDAVMRVRMAADLILDRKGGAGCVREFVERVMGEI